MKYKSSSGFTMVELILVIVVLGILAVSALPNFYDMRASAATASHQAIAGSINSGLGIYRSQSIVNQTTHALMEISPLVADGASCSAAAPCFTNIIPTGVSDNKWIKRNIVVYEYNGTTVYNYMAPTVHRAGSFNCVSGC